VASIQDRIFGRRISIHVYGLAAIVLSLVGLVWGDYAVVWQPVPDAVPGQTALGYAAAVPFLLAGLAMQWQRAAPSGALTLTVLYGLGSTFLDIPRVIAHPSVFVTWEGAAEQLALVAGGLVAWAHLAQLKPATAERVSKIGRLLFGACLFVFGLLGLFGLHSQAGSGVAAAESAILGVRHCRGIFCRGRCDSLRYRRAPCGQVADGNVRRVRRPGACPHGLHRPPYPLQLGRERN